MDDHTRLAAVTRAAFVPALLGLITGLTMALVWRYAAPRQLFDATDRPNTSPDDVGYLFVYDRLQYLDGPAWLPVVLVLPFAGAVIGAAIGAAGQLGLTLSAGHRRLSDQFVSAAALLITGTAVGAAGAFYARAWPPAVRFVARTDSSIDAGPPPATFEELVHGSPLRIDAGPPEIVFPLIGAALAVIFVVARHLSVKSKQSEAL